MVDVCKLSYVMGNRGDGTHTGMTRVIRPPNLATLALLASVGGVIAACGAPAPHDPAPVGPCEALARRLPHTSSQDDAVATLTEANTLHREVTQEAASLFHDGPRTAAERRAFFDRWVLVSPPILVVAEDRFVFHRALGERFVAAALAVGDLHAATAWSRRSALIDVDRDTLDRCVGERRLR